MLCPCGLQANTRLLMPDGSFMVSRDPTKEDWPMDINSPSHFFGNAVPPQDCSHVPWSSNVYDVRYSLTSPSFPSEVSCVDRVDTAWMHLHYFSIFFRPDSCTRGCYHYEHLDLQVDDGNSLDGDVLWHTTQLQYELELYYCELSCVYFFQAMRRREDGTTNITSMLWRDFISKGLSPIRDLPPSPSHLNSSLLRLLMSLICLRTLLRF